MVVVIIIITMIIVIIIMIIYLPLTKHLLITTTNWLGGHPENPQGNNRGHILSH